MTNSADPDQLASSSEANLSGSTLFAKTGHVVLSKRRVKMITDDYLISFSQREEENHCECYWFTCGQKFIAVLIFLVLHLNP